MPRPLKPLNPYASWSALFGATVQRLRLGLEDRPVVSQDEFGRRIGFDGSTVGAVERAALRPDMQFVEGCERVLPAGGMLAAMFPFVSAEWADFERLGSRPPTVPPPAEVLPSTIPAGADLNELLVGAAEAMELARRAEASDIGSGTLETIELRVDRYCRDYPSADPGLLIPKVHGRLGHVRRLLAGHVTLTQHRSLLVAGGWLATLLACLQFDLGNREAAELSRDAAFQLAREAEHPELLAWTYELLAWFSLVDGRYRDQIEFARTGLTIAPNTSAGVQLAVQEAKAWAKLGDRRGAEDAMRRAAGTLAKLPLPAHPDHHFVFDASKLSFYASTCYTWLGEVERAEEHGHQVVSQCLEVPSEVRWPMRLAETRVDLALIAVERGQLDEAVNLGVKALGSHRKSGHTLGRVAELDEVLMRSHPGVPVAAEFHEGFVEANRVLREAAT